MITAGSGEVLDVVGTTYLLNGKKVLGVEPSYNSVYQHATTIKSDAIKLPLTSDFRQDIDRSSTWQRSIASEIGFVYICNPNNPTGRSSPSRKSSSCSTACPPGMPVLIDEAYHHYVDDPSYATSMPYVNEGRPVIIARTFSKIAAMAAMRVGYAVATRRRSCRRCGRSRPAASTCSRTTARSRRSRTRRRWQRRSSKTLA